MKWRFCTANSSNKRLIGNSVSYAYDTTKGNLTSVTEPGNKTTSYTYNAANDLLTKVSQSGSSVAYEYVKRKLTGITSPNGTKYKFTYNNFSQCTATMVGNRTLATNSFDTLGRLKTTVYGNGNKVENVYDNLSRVTSVKYDNVTKVNYTYDNDGNVSKIDDKFSNITSAFRYDSIKRPISKVMSNGYTAEVRYDDKNRVESTVVSIGSEEHKTTYGYDKTGIITNVKSTYGDWLVGQYYDFDALKRVAYKYTEIDGDEVGWQEYIYAPGKTVGSTTSLVSEYSTNGGNSFQYTYDDRGNITKIVNNGVVEATYTYDSFDRLVSETANGVTTTWTYDANGNILTKTSGGTTVNYTYGDSEWKDLLTNYNGQAITYDGIGNPLKWGNTTFIWVAGRRLMSLNKSGVNASFTYDIDGYRTSKTVNGVTTTYYVDGGTITALKKGTDELMFFYDEKGIVVGFYYNDVPYVYVKNLQGDVIGIIDKSCKWVVSYSYDAWGKLLEIDGELADTLGKLNPFRYRGYVYDDETGLYYLNSRYYEPNVGRFISSDSVVAGVGQEIEGYNLFAYCFDNPVNMSDSEGCWPKWLKDTIKWVAKNVVKPIVKTVQKTISKVDATYSRGVNVSGTPSIFIGNAQMGVAVDTKGNVAVQWSAGGGVTGGSPGASITTYQNVTNASNINKLEGPGYQVGGSAGMSVCGVPMSTNGDFNIIPDTELNRTYYGITGNLGIGTPGAELHIEWGETWSLDSTSFNIFDVAREIYIKIMEW